MWYVCDVLYAVLYVRECAVSRRYINVCNCDMSLLLLGLCLCVVSVVVFCLSVRLSWFCDCDACTVVCIACVSAERV